MNMTQPTSTSLAPLTGTAAKQQTLKELLTKAAPSLAAVAPKHLSADRLVKIALSATSRNPDLHACSAASILRAVMQGAEMGLEVGGLMGDCYLVPFRNKHTKQVEAQCIPGYRGLIRLARNSGQIRCIEAHVVYEHDIFDLEYGGAQPIKHRPNILVEDRGRVICVWAKATFKDGGEQVEVMTLPELERIRKRSQAADDGPWVTDTAEMQRKTVVRRLCKYLPLSPELAKAVSQDEAVERGELQTIDVSLIEDGPAGGATPEEPKSNVAALKNKVAEKTKAEGDSGWRQPGED
jgi:recombination protein RecT